jgi:hypothetical protein
MFAQNQGWLASADAASTAANATGGATEPVSNIGAMIDAPSAGMDTVAAMSDEAVSSGGGLMTEGLPDTNAMGGSPQSVVQQAITEPKGLIDTGPGASPLAGNPTDMRLASGTQTAPLAGARSSGSIFDTIKGLFTDSNGKTNKDMLALAGNFIGGAFDQKKEAEGDLLSVRAETERAQLKNASDIPNMGLGTKKTAPTFRPPGPTYYGPKIGLIGAR